jgi:hypothetical protein
LAAIDPTVLDKDQVDSWAVGVERVRRAADAAAVEVADHVDTHNPFRRDGFFNAKSWMKHRLQLSGPEEAFRRLQTARLHRRVGVWANAESSGHVGVAQTQLMAQVAANPRIEPELLRTAGWDLLEDAMDLSYDKFERRIRVWEALADPAGATSKADDGTANRDAQMRPRPDGGWNLTAAFDGVGGAEFNEIFAHFIDAEWRDDWAEARGRLAEVASVGDLCRRRAQRCADALLAMARAAAAAPVDGGRPRCRRSIC